MQLDALQQQQQQLFKVQLLTLFRYSFWTNINEYLCRQLNSILDDLYAWLGWCLVPHWPIVFRLSRTSCRYARWRSAPAEQGVSVLSAAAAARIWNQNYRLTGIHLTLYAIITFWMYWRCLRLTGTRTNRWKMACFGSRRGFMNRGTGRICGSYAAPIRTWS